MNSIYRILSTVFIVAELFPLFALTASIVSINKCPGSSLGNRLAVPASAINTDQQTTFRLRNEFKPCKNEQRVRARLLPIRRKSSVDDEEPGLKRIDQSYFTVEGLLRHKNEYYYPEEYCVNAMSGSTVEATLCPPSCRRNRPCVRKCCPIGEVVDMEMAGCRPAGNQRWAPTFHINETTAVSNEENGRMRPHIINLPPNCKYSNGSISEEYSSIPLRSLKVDGYQLDTIPIRLLKDGNLIYYAITDKWEPIPRDMFCIDGMQNFGEVKSYSGLPSDQIVFSCVDSYTQ